MRLTYSTARLQLDRLKPSDDEFILELVNTPEWIKFIGDRKVKTLEEANQYILRIITSPDINYWVVRLTDHQTPIGVITFIKKDYLHHHDIGFAFLERYTKSGYAYEAAKAVLDDASESGHNKVLATSIKENIKSIRLLEKLGFSFDKEKEVKGEVLLIYSVATQLN
jgi:[ribosomal protein S5]-alanine N-acetyltransferase